MFEQPDLFSSPEVGGSFPSPPPPPAFLPPVGNDQWDPLQFPLRRDPTKKQIEHAKEEVPKMMKRSAEFMQTKRALIKLVRDLYFNRRRLDEWYPYTDRSHHLSEFVQMITTMRSSLLKATGQPQPSWRSDFTVAISPSIDAYVESFVQAVFSQEDYFLVTAGPRNATGSVEDAQFSTADKIQTKLVQTADDMLFRSAIDAAMRDAAITGTLAAKVPWYEETRLEPGLNGWGILEFKEQVVRHGADFVSLDLSRFLPDPDATTSDCQKWRFVGDRTEVDWEVLAKRFDSPQNPGPYNIGKKEFFEKWKDAGTQGHREVGKFLVDDPDRDTATTHGKGRLQVWEFHGKVHFPGDSMPTECVATCVTELSSDDPTGGVLVRLQLQPALKAGIRPYCVYHFIRQNGPLGIGLIEQNSDVLWMLSQAQNLFIDACRLMSIPMFKARQDALFVRDLDKDDVANMAFPGKIIYYDSDPNEVQPMWLQANLQPVLQLIQFLEGQLEKRTSISATTRGVSDNRKTATEFAGLIQQSLRPINAKLAIFKETVLDVYAKIAVCYLQSYVFEDQSIFITDTNGIPQPTTLTVEELQTGEYTVKAVLDLPDQTKISKAQTIMQLIPIIMQLQVPLLQFEGKRVKLAGLIEALLRNLEITEMANVIETLDVQTQQQMLMSMMPPGPQGQVPPGSEGQQGQGQLEPGTDGGPLGPEPTDLNQILQMMQFQGQLNGPVPPGQQVAAA